MSRGARVVNVVVSLVLIVVGVALAVTSVVRAQDSIPAPKFEVDRSGPSRCRATG